MNAAHNGAVPASGSISIGFQATHTGNTARPSAFALNGNTCSTA
jgi:hypothetical protein